MRTEHSIAELLYRYDCVVVPDFGAFLTQRKSAIIQEGTNAFYPPSKVISFNSQLASNDGLLVSYMADDAETTYEIALQEIAATVANWKKQLKKGERILFEGIGELWRNSEGKIQFEPTTKINYLTSSFGLSSFVSTPVVREVLKQEVEALEEDIPFIITPEQRKESGLRPYLKYAAVVLLAISAGFTGYRVYNDTISTQQLAQEEAQEVVSKNIQEATFFDTNPLQLPSITLKVDKKSSGIHHVIAGAFRDQANADKKVRQLRRRGFKASLIGKNAYGLHQVSYDSFNDAQEALSYLKKIKRTESVDAWLLSKK